MNRGGKDGADLALIEVITTEDNPRRFGRVVVASGDGIFADAIAYLAAAGTPAPAPRGRRGPRHPTESALCAERGLVTITSPNDRDKPAFGGTCGRLRR